MIDILVYRHYRVYTKQAFRFLQRDPLLEIQLAEHKVKNISCKRHPIIEAICELPERLQPHYDCARTGEIPDAADADE